MMPRADHPTPANNAFGNVHLIATDLSNLDNQVTWSGQGQTLPPLQHGGPGPVVITVAFSNVTFDSSSFDLDIIFVDVDNSEFNVTAQGKNDFTGQVKAIIAGGRLPGRFFPSQMGRFSNTTVSFAGKPCLSTSYKLIFKQIL